MKKIFIAVSLFFFAPALYAQSQLFMGTKWLRANFDTIVQRVSSALGTGYGITDESVYWVGQANLPYYEAKASLEKGWGIDKTVTKSDFPHVDVEIQAFLMDNSDTLIMYSNISGQMKDVIKVYSTFYKSSENADSIHENLKAKTLVMPSSGEGLDETVGMQQTDPYLHTWAMQSGLVRHVEKWKPEMAAIYGSRKEVLLQQSAAKLLEDPYFCLFWSFKIIYGEQLSTFLQYKMKCKLIKQTNTPTAEEFLFARNGEARDMQNISLTLAINPEKRITSVKVTGSVAAMEQLYERFWLRPMGDDEERGPLRGVTTRAGDFVVLKKDGNSASITVTKKPGFDYSKVAGLSF